MSKQITPEVEAEVIDVFKRTRGSPFKTATETGVDVKDVWDIVDRNKDKISAFEERHGGQGRPELQRYLAATRRAGDRGWDLENAGVVRARANLELGTHIMATGRDGQWLLLYSIPRKGPRDPKPGYFQPEHA